VDLSGWKSKVKVRVFALMGGFFFREGTDVILFEIFGGWMQKM